MSDAAAPQGDDAILDAALDAFVAACSDGREPDVAAAAPGRPDLLPRLRELADIAREIAPRRAPERPVFAGYEILRELGRGGMGHVHVARHVKLGRVVALKVLPRISATSRARDRFLREARAVARLEHPLVVPVYDMGEEAGQPYFTMALVEGATLGAAIQSVRERDPASLTGHDLARAAGAGATPARWSGPWWRAAACALADVADALAYAHSQGVVHRDVKPSNVMLRRDGFALLFDFGLAAVEDEATLTLTHGFVGTPHYASPEQAAGGTESLDGRSDVFSLGAALYEALTLRLPFPGPTTHEVLRRIQTWEPEPPSRAAAGLPRDLETVVLAALEKDRDRRTASAADVARDLRAVLDGRRVHAKRAGLLERGLRSVRKGRALTELLVEQQARNAELRSAVLRAERNEAEAREARAAAEASLRRAEESQRRAEESRLQAESERDRAEAIQRFLLETFASADPAVDGRDVRVVDALERAAVRALDAFPGRPEVRGEVSRVVAQTLYDLGESARSHDVAAQALRDAQADLPGDHPLVVRLLGATACAASALGRVEESIALARAAVASAHVLTPDQRLVAETDLGFILFSAGRNDEAAQVLDPALARCVERCGEDAELTLRVRQNLGLSLLDGPRSAEGASHIEASWRGRRARFGPVHPETIVAAGNHGQVLKEAGRLEEALGVVRASVTPGAAVLGDRHMYVVIGRHNLAGILTALGRLAEAEEIQRAAIAGADAHGDGAAETAGRTRLQLARILLLAGRRDDAREAVRSARPHVERSGSEFLKSWAEALEREAG